MIYWSEYSTRIDMTSTATDIHAGKDTFVTAQLHSIKDRKKRKASAQYLRKYLKGAGYYDLSRGRLLTPRWCNIPIKLN